MRRCRTRWSSRRARARRMTWVWWWSLAETSWSAGRGCALTSLRGDAGFGTFGTDRVTPSPPVTCSSWCPAQLSCLRRFYHDVNAVSGVPSSSGAGRILGEGGHLVDSVWASSPALVVARGHFHLCWPRSVGRWWEPLCANPLGPSELWQVPGWDRKPGSLWESLL